MTWTDPLVVQTQVVVLGNVYDEQTKDGVAIPNFHARLKKGELLPFTPYSRTRKVLQSRSGTASCGKSDGSYYETYDMWWAGKARWFGATDLSSLSLPDGQALVQAAAAKIYSSGWDALTFAAELKQTIAMFENLLNGNFFRTAMRAVKGDLKSASNLDLEVRYGWRTFVYDIQDFVKALDSISEKRTRYKERVGVTEVARSSGYTDYSFGLGTHRYTTSVETTVGVRGSVVADVSPPKISLNVAVTLWEITTLSFVIDWFLQVGAYLESLSFMAISAQYYAAYGTDISTVTRFSVRTVSADNGCYSNFKCDTVALELTRTRTPTTIPLLPKFRVNLNVNKVIDLLALLRQRV